MTKFAKLTTGLALAAATFALPSAGEAAILYRLEAAEAVNGAQPGNTATVTVYLYETVTGGDTSRLVAENGLFSVGARINRTASTGTGVSPTGAAVDPAFNDTQSRTSSVSATAAQFTGAIVAPPFVGPTGTDLGGGVRRVTVGTFSFLIPGGATGGSTFTLGDIAGSDDTLTNFGTTLDSAITSTSFTVLAPEPASLAALAGVGLVALRRRRA